MRLPYLPWLPESYNNNFPFSSVQQTKNAVLNLLERKANRDSLHSYPLVLQVEVTKRCNIHCVMCLRESIPKEDMFPEVMSKLIPLSRHLGEIQLYGYGEPLISRPFYSLISSLECARLSFTTNGTVLKPKLLHRILSEAKRPVYGIFFSIDAGTAKTYEEIRRGSNFRRVVSNLAYIDAYRKKHGLNLPKTDILFLAMKKNIRELPDVVRLAARIGVSTVQVAHLIVWDEADRNESLLYHPEEMRRSFAEAMKTASELNVNLNLPALITLDEGRNNGRGLPAIQKCFLPWRHPVIKYNGDVQPCCAAPDAVMGNVLTEPFQSIWNGPRFRHFRRRVNTTHPPEVCRTCDIRYRHVASLNHIERVYIRPPPKTR